MNRKLGAYLELIRVPNIFTAAADILAGGLYVGGTLNDWPAFVLLCCSSALFYAGGMALNDVCDAAADTRQRPARPIPSGRVSRKEAGVLAGALLVSALLLTTLVSWQAVKIAGTLATAIVLYDALPRSNPIGPGIMGLCRGLNLLLGMSIIHVSATAEILLPLFLIWLYVTSLTLFARHETEGSPPVSAVSRQPAAIDHHPSAIGLPPSARWIMWLAAAGLCAGVVGLMSLRWVIDAQRLEPSATSYRLSAISYQGYVYWWLTGGLLVVVGYRGWRTAVSGLAIDVQAAVKLFVAALIVFDTCIVVAARGPIVAVGVVWTLLPTILLGYRFRMT